MSDSKSEKTKKEDRQFTQGLFLALLGLLIAGAGFYEISEFKEGEGSVWGLVAFVIGGIVLLFGIFRALGINLRSIFHP